jgi:hypothetical protein
MDISNRFLTADYRDGRVRIGGKSYPTGIYANHLLNQYYKNDTAARLSVYKQHGWNVAEQLEHGYLKTKDYILAGEEILHILDTLPKLKPFDTLNIEAERKRMSDLFTESVAESILDFFSVRAEIAQCDEGQVALNIFPSDYESKKYKIISTTISEVQSTLSFYNCVSTDMQKVFAELTAFVSRADEAIRLDEAHLLPIALEIFGETPSPLNVQYVPYKKNAKSQAATVARRLYFDSYYSFVLTDFFEGLHYGHYPRKCDICGNYFLMTSARRQRYCTGTAPYKIRGKKVSCRAYAASINRKELAAADPIVDIYTRRCNAIRSEKSRGTITEEFAAKALEIAKEYKLIAQDDDEYAKKQYSRNMKRDNLYIETDKQLK